MPKKLRVARERLTNLRKVEKSYGKILLHNNTFCKKLNEVDRRKLIKLFNKFTLFSMQN